MCLLLFLLLTKSSSKFRSCKEVLWWDLKPNCSGRIFGRMINLSLLRIRRSKSFEIEFMRDMGRWLDGNVGSLPGFGIMMTEAFFHW